MCCASHSWSLCGPKVSYIACTGTPRYRLACLMGYNLLLVAANTFRFANMFGDHMVLQRAPTSANIWGYIEGCGQVTVVFNGQRVTAKVIHGEGDVYGTCSGWGCRAISKCLLLLQTTRPCVDGWSPCLPPAPLVPSRSRPPPRWPGPSPSAMCSLETCTYAVARATCSSLFQRWASFRARGYYLEYICYGHCFWGEGRGGGGGGALFISACNLCRCSTQLKR